MLLTIEDEMREVLAESAAVKKAYEEKVKSYSPKCNRTLSARLTFFIT